MSRILGNTELPGGARLLRVALADPTTVLPGHWFRLELADHAFCLPVLDHSPREGWVAFCAPEDTRHHGRGTPCAVTGPWGEPVSPPCGNRRLVLVADDTGLPAAIFATTHLDIRLVLVGLETDTPAFRLRPSRFIVPGMGAGAIAGVGALEDAGVPSRVAHPEPLPGCRDGLASELVDDWVAGQSARERWDTAVALLALDGTVAMLRERLRGRVGEVHSHPLPAAA